MLRDAFLNRGHHQSKIDPCPLCKSDSIVVTCFDDYTMLAKDHEKFKAIVVLLQKNFKIVDEGDLSTCLGEGNTKYPND